MPSRRRDGSELSGDASDDSVSRNERRRSSNNRNDRKRNRSDSRDEMPSSIDRLGKKDSSSLSSTDRSSGGAKYIPPGKLAQMRAKGVKEDAADEQKISWEALRKSINGLINKANASNIKYIVPELFQENLSRGRGLFVRAVMIAQAASPKFTPIYAALIAIVNTKLPQIGELLLKRVIHGFNKAYRRRKRMEAQDLSKFIGHLVNHRVANELLALQLLGVLLEQPTNDSVEIAAAFVKDVGKSLEELSPRGLHAIFEQFRGVLHEGEVSQRVQYSIEDLFAVRKGGFAAFPAVPEELDLVRAIDVMYNMF